MASSWTGRRDAQALQPRPRRARGTVAWLHRWLGLTVGLVLAVQGTTGALLAFRPELQVAMAPAYVLADAARLPLADVVAHAERDAAPGQALRFIAWESSDGAYEVRYGGEGGDATWLVDPATGERVARPWGDAAFWTIERVHRTFALGDAGHWITFAAAIALLALVALGIVLRLPMRESLGRWLSPRSPAAGLPRWRKLHAVAGTWLLPLFLLTALTGLFWASDAYRNLLLKLAGQPPRPPRPAVMEPPVRPLPALERALTTFAATAPDASRVVFQVPRDAQAGIELRYLAPDAPHDRAFGTVRLTTEGALVAHEPFAAQPAGKRALAYVYPLHSGSWLGVPGRMLMMVSAATMPALFAIGLYLWLGARRRRRGLRAEA